MPLRNQDRLHHKGHCCLERHGYLEGREEAAGMLSDWNEIQIVS